MFSEDGSIASRGKVNVSKTIVIEATLGTFPSAFKNKPGSYCRVFHLHRYLRLNYLVIINLTMRAETTFILVIDPRVVKTYFDTNC